MTTLVWFRNDLRVADHPALADAADRGPVVGCFAFCARQFTAHDVGEVRLAFLLRSLRDVISSLAGRGIAFHVIQVPTFAEVPTALVRLASKTGADRVVFNDEYPDNERRRDDAAVTALTDSGVVVKRFHGGVTLPPGAVLTKTGSPYKVFTPFKRRWLELVALSQVEPLEAPPAQGEPLAPLPVTSIDHVRESRLADLWPAGEHQARSRLVEFLDARAGRYADDRDVPGVDGTSRLSPYLSVGSISQNQCLHAAAVANGGRLGGGSLDAWINELIWREFYRHLTAMFPHVSRGHAFRRQYDAIAWRDAPEELTAWQEGKTGYPLVDAGMRQLLDTGWMHNRLRMVVAMFLSKHLLIDWREGERYFMRHLVDGDFASNNGGWQWSASTGADAAPYFRVFNPTTQAKKFDRRGTFIRSLVPELRDVAGADVFSPGARGRYPAPIVEHRMARERAIQAFKKIG